MIKQDITVVEGITFIQELKTECDISGFSFELRSNHPERNLPQNYLEVYDNSLGWINGKALNPTGDVRIHIPDSETSNWHFLSGFKYSITAKSVDGIKQVVANGSIKYKKPEDAEPTDVIEFNIQGVTDNLISKLKPIIESEALKYKQEKKQLTISDIDKLQESLLAIRKDLSESISKSSKEHDCSLHEKDSANNAKIKVIEDTKANKQDVEILSNSINKKIDSFALFNGDILRLNGNLVINKDGTASIHGVHINKDSIISNNIKTNSIHINEQDVTSLFALKNGSSTEEFKAKSIILDGVDISYVKTLEQRIQSLSKRISELESTNGN